MSAASALADAALALNDGGVRSVEQSGGGRLYKRADFSAAAVKQLYANVADGMIGEYLHNRVARDARLSLVRLEPVSAAERTAR